MDLASRKGRKHGPVRSSYNGDESRSYAGGVAKRRVSKAARESERSEALSKDNEKLYCDVDRWMDDSEA